jgi:hypothetical protein
MIAPAQKYFQALGFCSRSNKYHIMPFCSPRPGQPQNMTWNPPASPEDSNNLERQPAPVRETHGFSLHGEARNTPGNLKQRFHLL